MKRPAYAFSIFLASLLGGAASRAENIGFASGFELTPLNSIELPDYSEDGNFSPKAAQIPPATVSVDEAEVPGSIIVSTRERRLYLVTARGSAIRYAIGVGRDGFGWHGTEKVTRKAIWPDWRPPADMRKRRPDLPLKMDGGPNNPLGARALYLGSTLYRIHGSNEPHTIGSAVSSGCIRMTNEDVIDLYERVQLGATVIVRH